MATCFPSEKTTLKDTGAPEITAARESGEIEVGLLTGGTDKPYTFGMAMALTSHNVRLDFIGSDEIDSPELRANPKLTFLNLRGNLRERVNMKQKVSKTLNYYARLIQYVFSARPKVLHILWNNKFEYFDRTLLLLYYKVLGKKIIFTAHNVNSGIRDAKDSFFNRLSLRIQYHLVDHIFVHTEAMKEDLRKNFGVRKENVTVIPFGINNAVPHTDLTPDQAKQKLGIRNGEKTILFFGRIRQYKGLESLVDAFQRIAPQDPSYRLIIGGHIKKGSEEYVKEIQATIRSAGIEGQVTQKFQYIPDEETEIYFKAADVFVLPYSDVFQSGVLFLGYSFGLPVIATDVGSMKEDIVEGETGFLCKPRDSADLAKTIETFFESGLYKTLNRRRPEIQEYANQKHSWDVVGQMTRDVYLKFLGKNTA